MGVFRKIKQNLIIYFLYYYFFVLAIFRPCLGVFKHSSKVFCEVLFGNLLAYHLYFWEKKKAKNESEKAQVKRSNMKGKFIHTMVKVVVYILLNICQRIFNLKYPMIPALLIGATIVLAIQLCLFSIFLLAIYSENRFKSDVEAVTQKKLWPEYLTHLKLQPFISIIFALIRLCQYYIFMDISIERISAKDAGEVPSYRYYKLYPLFYVIPAILISLVYIVFNFMHKLELRIFSVSADWGPVNKDKWKRIKPFRPGRNLVFYDKFYISHHLCFINHNKIRQVSMEQIQNIQHFAMKWPCIFETLKYKHHKEQVDQLVTEAYTWGILASFEESQ